MSVLEAVVCMSTVLTKISSLQVICLMNKGPQKALPERIYSIVPIKHTVFFSTVTVSKNTVRLIGTIE